MAGFGVTTEGKDRENEPLLYRKAVMPVQYYFDNLDPTSFQRLINGLLVRRYGEALRLLPLRGPDGGRDLETAPSQTLFKVVTEKPDFSLTVSPLPAGRYLFQAKTSSNQQSSRYCT